MAKEKICRNCNLVYEGDKCPGCGSQEYNEEAKGKIIINDPEKSEIARKLKIQRKGTYAIKSS